jgi:hypothetical protein
MSSSPEKLAFQPPHKLNAHEKAFLQSLSPREKELQNLATQMLGSSHFLGKTHGFAKWQKSSQDTQSPATK